MYVGFLVSYIKLADGIQIEWHAGSTLSQSVYTLLHVHRLDALNPDLVPFHFTDRDKKTPANKPIQLLTSVLRAGIFGLLKCCDAAWRELSRGRVIDVRISPR
jgi:N-alpha-acetyltransferase 35, NatC auxiliary subunit